ncbi:hypothetical protein [Flavobacterium franklandianum]|nr:hypothetical protein [Flavobacterium franklandianum]
MVIAVIAVILRLIKGRGI